MAALTIEERVAWFHRAATTLQVDGNLAQLKRATKALIAVADLLLQAIRAQETEERGVGGQNCFGKCPVTACPPKICVSTSSHEGGYLIPGTAR